MKKFLVVTVVLLLCFAFLASCPPNTWTLSDSTDIKAMVKKSPALIAAGTTDEKLKALSLAEQYYFEGTWRDDFEPICLSELIACATADKVDHVRAAAINLFEATLLPRTITASTGMTEAEIAKKNAVHGKNTRAVAEPLMEKILRSRFEILRNCSAETSSDLAPAVGHLLAILSGYDSEFKKELNRFLGRAEDTVISTEGMRLDVWDAFWKKAAAK